MAWDDDTMKQSKWGHFLVNAGTYAFSGSGTTVEVPTYLTTLYAAFVTGVTAVSAGNEHYHVAGTYPLDVTNGTITVSRIIQVDTGDSSGTPAVTSGVTFSFIFLGV